jgi:uncharacterized protein
VIALAPHGRGTVLPVRAQPGAKRDAILGERAGPLRVAVSAPPEHGRANAAIRALLAAALGCQVSQVGLLSGASARAKRYLILDLAPDELRARLDALL